MALTHYMSATSPVFRWMMFHVYANNGIGWYVKKKKRKTTTPPLANEQNQRL
jgi:hypothetical protein